MTAKIIHYQIRLIFSFEDPIINCYIVLSSIKMHSERKKHNFTTNVKNNPHQFDPLSENCLIVYWSSIFVLPGYSE